MSEPLFRKGDFVVYTDNAEGPIYEVDTVGEFLFVIRDANGDAFSVDPAILTLYSRQVTREELQSTIAAQAERIGELESHVLLLAKLSADEPQFFNPLEAMAAATLRDRILAATTKGTSE